MDTLQIFPALLALMIATLAALGYALHRLEEVPNRFVLPLRQLDSVRNVGGTSPSAGATVQRVRCWSSL